MGLPGTEALTDGYDQKRKRNADGFVDTYFGPKAPAGQEANAASPTIYVLTR